MFFTGIGSSANAWRFIGMFTRGEVGAGVIFIALGYKLGWSCISYFKFIVLNLDSDRYLCTMGEEGIAKLYNLAVS